MLLHVLTVLTVHSSVSSTVLLEVTYNTYVEFLHCIQYVMLTLFFIIIKFEAETQWTNRNKV